MTRSGALLVFAAAAIALATTYGGAISGRDPGDRLVARVYGGQLLYYRTDGGWAVTVSADGGPGGYSGDLRVVPIQGPYREVVARPNGWFLETVLSDGGRLSEPAQAPPGR